MRGIARMTWTLRETRKQKLETDRLVFRFLVVRDQYCSVISRIDRVGYTIGPDPRWKQARATLANFINPAFRKGCDSIVSLKQRAQWV